MVPDMQKNIDFWRLHA